MERTLTSKEMKAIRNLLLPARVEEEVIKMLSAEDAPKQDWCAKFIFICVRLLEITTIALLIANLIPNFYFQFKKIENIAMAYLFILYALGPLIMMGMTISANSKWYRPIYLSLWKKRNNTAPSWAFTIHLVIITLLCLNNHMFITFFWIISVSCIWITKKIIADIVQRRIDAINH